MSALAAVPPKKRPYNRVRVGIRDGRIVRLKVCPLCGVEGVCTEGPDSDFTPRTRDAEGHVLGWHAYDKRCNAIYRERYRAGINARRAVRHRDRMKNDPAYRARRIEDKRILYTLQHGPVKRRGQRPKDASLLVPAEPFRLWLKAYSKATSLTGCDYLARNLDIMPARIRLVQEGQENVALDVVDRALGNATTEIEIDGKLIQTLNDLYPLSST